MSNQFSKIRASFSNAFRGLAVLIKEERNARIHLLSMLLVIAAGAYFNLNTVEWCFIIFAVGLVFILEAINTVIENLIDFVSLEQNPKIGKIKDLAAGAVLIAAIVAVAIACVIFIPKIWILIQ